MLLRDKILIIHVNAKLIGDGSGNVYIYQQVNIKACKKMIYKKEARSIHEIIEHSDREEIEEKIQIAQYRKLKYRYKYR